MESIHERDGISTPSRDEHLDQVAAEKVDTTHPIRLDEAQTPSPQRVHAKTFLALFAMCLIYFAETFALIGAGSVCPESGSSLGETRLIGLWSCSNPKSLQLTSTIPETVSGSQPA